MFKKLYQKLFLDKHGDRVIFQPLNIPLGVWLSSTIAARFLARHGTAHTALSLIASISLAVWAILELVRGVNYFRRILGGLVLLMIIVSKFVR